MFQKYIIDMKSTNIKYVVQYIKQKCCNFVTLTKLQHRNYLSNL